MQNSNHLKPKNQKSKSRHLHLEKARNHPMGFPGAPWNRLEFLAIPWNSLGTHWSSLEFPGNPPGLPWRNPKNKNLITWNLKHPNDTHSKTLNFLENSRSAKIKTPKSWRMPKVRKSAQLQMQTTRTSPLGVHEIPWIRLDPPVIPGPPLESPEASWNASLQGPRGPHKPFGA